jgi:hypothetical protein
MDQPTSRTQRTLIVPMYSDDDGDLVDLGRFAERISQDINERARDGWRLHSQSITALRQAGTTAGVIFDSGGQVVTQLGAILVYERD